MNETRAKTDIDTQPSLLSITVHTGPMEEVGRQNLKQLIEAKRCLLSAVFDTEDLSIVFDDETVTFPWFSPYDTPEEIHAYCTFVSLLCGMAQKLKRTSAEEKATDNPKYSFRCFLLRLGFIGDEFKADRQELLKNLNGSSAFRTVAKEEPETETADPRVIALAKMVAEIEAMKVEDDT